MRITGSSIIEDSTGFFTMIHHEYADSFYGCGCRGREFKSRQEAEDWIELEHKLSLLGVDEY